ALVMRAGELLKGAGCKDAAIEVYERFIAGLQRCAMSTIQPSKYFAYFMESPGIMKHAMVGASTF
ncbi:MAG: hypothetical protein Q6370_023380, partial [Candidatus Sigynarchaeota archaeon]